MCFRVWVWCYTSWCVVLCRLMVRIYKCYATESCRGDLEFLSSCPLVRCQPRHAKMVFFCLCENKGADQLCSNCTADQRLCFRYMDSIFLLHNSEISSCEPPSVTVQASLCQTLLEIWKTCFLALQLILYRLLSVLWLHVPVNNFSDVCMSSGKTHLSSSGCKP